MLLVVGVALQQQQQQQQKQQRKFFALIIEYIGSKHLCVTLLANLCNTFLLFDLARHSFA